MTQDEDQLRLLSIFHYVVGGLAGLFALFPIFHLIFGLFFILAPNKFAGKGEPPPAFIGWFFVILAAVFITLGWILLASSLPPDASWRGGRTIYSALSWPAWSVFL